MCKMETIPNLTGWISSPASFCLMWTLWEQRHLSVAPRSGLGLSWIGLRGAGEGAQYGTMGRPEPFSSLLHFEMCYEDREALLASGVDPHSISSEEGLELILS